MKLYKFTDCVELVGTSCPKFNGLKKYVSTGAIDVDYVNEKDIEIIDYKNKPSRANLCAEAGDIIFAKMQNTKKILMLDNETEGYIYSTGFCAVRARDGIILPKCLFHLLGSNTFLSQKDVNCSGATQKAITNAGLGKIYLSIPAFREQNKIAEQLDSIAHIVKTRRKELARLDELVKARFVEMFSGVDYPEMSLSEVCKKITDGTHKTPQYQDEGVTFISAKNIIDGRLDFSDIKYISVREYQEIQRRCQVERGDILLTKSGSLGMTAMVENDEPLGLFESLAILKYDRVLLNGIFLCYQMQSDEVQRRLMANIKGVAIKHLHLNVIAATKVFIPPLELQQRFADFVTQVDKSKFVIQKALNETQTLFDSLMQKYFG